MAVSPPAAPGDAAPRGARSVSPLPRPPSSAIPRPTRVMPARVPGTTRPRTREQCGPGGLSCRGDQGARLWGRSSTLRLLPAFLAGLRNPEAEVRLLACPRAPRQRLLGTGARALWGPVKEAERAALLCAPSGSARYGEPQEPKPKPSSLGTPREGSNCPACEPQCAAEALLGSAPLPLARSPPGLRAGGSPGSGCAGPELAVLEPREPPRRSGLPCPVAAGLQLCLPRPAHPACPAALMAWQAPPLPLAFIDDTLQQHRLLGTGSTKQRAWVGFL